MKKLLLVCGICLATLFANAQQSKEAADFNAYYIKADSSMHAAYALKDYPKSIALANEWFDRYDKLSPAFKKNNPGYLPGMYYNLACYTSMNGEKNKAISYFEKAYKAGFSNYTLAKTDSDLNSLRDDEQFKAILNQLREKGDYNYVLKKAGPYNKEKADLPVFTYQAASAPELVNFKTKFNLDSVSGNGDEISKIKNLLYWAHDVVRHDGNSNNPPSRNAIDLIAVCKKDDRGVNCRMMATILKDAYQAEGFKARLVTCMPKDTADFDCHVITVVWSKTLNKWIWMDPTFCAYMKDDKGNYLSIEEVRERLISDSPLVLNEDANWNHKNKETKEVYLNYMSKNLYWIRCAAKSEWDLETMQKGKPAVQYVNLYPGKFTTINSINKFGGNKAEYATNNPGYFWQKPIGE